MHKTKKKNKRSKRIPKLNHILRTKKTWVIIGVTLLLLAGGIFRYTTSKGPNLVIPNLPPPPTNALYKQAGAPIEDRVNDLLHRMTLEEKIGQMSLVDKRSVHTPEDVKIYGLGGILSGAGAKPSTNNALEWRKMVDGYKQQAAQSRLGIPLYYGIDANHGHANVLGATIFPHQIGLGASQNPELIRAVASATSEELRATGINWNYSPSLDAPKDMRWGRVYEAFSESAELNARLGSAFIEGTQQNVAEDQAAVTASAKHFFGAGSMIWDKSNHKHFKIDQGRLNEDEGLLNSELLVPYKAAVESGVGSIMVALTDYGNKRIIDNEYLLTHKLKGELGFDGFIVSDWYGVYEYDRTSDYKANIRTINAGLDMAMLPYDYKQFIFDVRKAVQKGDIKQARIDDAVKRILRQKFKAGLFDKPNNSVTTDIVGSSEHRKLAREAVAASAVLLKNNNVLPLSKGVGSILVAGSGADNVGRQSGAWTVEWQGVDGNWIPGATTVLQGIRNVTKDSGTKVEFNANGTFAPSTQKAEIGIAVVSEKPYAEGWGDNGYPEIEKSDLEAINRLKQHAHKVVIVIISGRPLFIEQHIQGWDALVAAWLPGSEGAGIADVLFGDKPFTAKSPITWLLNLKQIPTKNSGITADGTEPLFRFNYGITTR